MCFNGQVLLRNPSNLGDLKNDIWTLDNGIGRFLREFIQTLRIQSIYIFIIFLKLKIY